MGVDWTRIDDTALVTFAGIACIREMDRAWFAGVLAIASEHSRYHLVLGSRFLALLTVAAKSPMIGAVIDELRVPFPSARPPRNVEPGAPPKAAPPHR